jgi:CubicO group peptidase (beta-lactamase class C family)
MLLNDGEFDGSRILSRTTVRLMTADHLGTEIPAPGLEVLAPGYTFGLGFGVRDEPGIAPVQGSVGEYMFPGHAGTTFWVDPEEELVGILMTQAPPGQIQAYYSLHIRQLVHQAIAD